MRDRLFTDTPFTPATLFVRLTMNKVLTDFSFCIRPKRALLTIVSGLIFVAYLAGCVAHDEIYITISDAVISPNTIANVEAVLKGMGVEEVKQSPNYPNAPLLFSSSDVALSHFNVFIPPLNKRPWRLIVGVAGDSNFSEYQKLMYKKLVVNLQAKFGNLNIVADTHSRSGQEVIIGNPDH